MATSVEPLIDIDRLTGELISGWDRCKQSILTILTTRLRTRLMRLWWGSEFLDLQDKPGNQESIMRSIVAAAQAINLYEPEFKITRMVIDEFGPSGAISITVHGDYLPDLAPRRAEFTL